MSGFACEVCGGEHGGHDVYCRYSPRLEVCGRCMTYHVGQQCPLDAGNDAARYAAAYEHRNIRTEDWTDRLVELHAEQDELHALLASFLTEHEARESSSGRMLGHPLPGASPPPAYQAILEKARAIRQSIEKTQENHNA